MQFGPLVMLVMLLLLPLQLLFATPVRRRQGRFRSHPRASVLCSWHTGTGRTAPMHPLGEACTLLAPSSARPRMDVPYPLNPCPKPPRKFRGWASRELQPSDCHQPTLPTPKHSRQPSHAVTSPIT